MKVARTLAATTALLALTACGSDTATGTGADGDRVEVAAAFYPLQWVSERVGGDHVTVTGLTRPGVEPHDLELTPKVVAELAASDLVVHLAGFQPAVDEAVATQAPDAGFDVSPAAGLTLAAGDDGATDPHFWLDPLRLRSVATAVAERLATQDPARAADYRAAAAALAGDLEALDAEFTTGLARCGSDDLVTAHAAFAYLADRYGLNQEGIAGVTPDTEPDAATLRELDAFVEEHDVRTIYTETLVDPAVAQTLARETGEGVAVLDPLEGLSDASAGTDYLEVMRSNLAVLRTGQGCT